MKGSVKFWFCILAIGLLAGLGLVGTEVSAGEAPIAAVNSHPSVQPELQASFKRQTEYPECTTCDPRECTGQCAWGKAGFGVWACTGLPCEERCECVLFW
jgi:hypothetical protein